MLNRPHGKKMGIIILAALIVISLAEVIFRSVTMGLESMSTSNFGEQLAVIAFAVTILILTAKGKDRACYICYGAWIGYFVLDQIFELPGFVLNWLNYFGTDIVGDITAISHILSMIAIVGIGVLLVEYLNDGTIYNKAFKTLCVAIIVFLVVNIGANIYASIHIDTILMLDVFNNIYRLIMVFLTAFFAYDSAKMQLAKLKK